MLSAHNTESSSESQPPYRREKRNVYLNGKRTTLSIESYVWLNLERIAAEEGTTVDAICTEINRRYKGQTSLSSVIRYLSHEMGRLKDAGASENNPSGDTLHESPQPYQSPPKSATPSPTPFPSPYQDILNSIGTLY